MKKNDLKLVVLAVLITSLLSLSPSLSVAGTITDNFAGSTINRKLWQLLEQTPQQRVTQQGGELLIQIDQNSSGMGAVVAKFLLKGDFDVKVDYRLVTQPTNNGVRLGIESSNDVDQGQYFEAKRSSLRLDDPYPNNKDSYRALFEDGSSWYGNDVATTDGQGSLRVTRVGQVFTGYYKQSGIWQQIASHDFSASGFKEWVRIMLGAASGDGNLPPLQNIQIAFSNFQVIYDQVKYLSFQTPVTMLLMD